MLNFLIESLELAKLDSRLDGEDEETANGVLQGERENDEPPPLEDIPLENFKPQKSTEY